MSTIVPYVHLSFRDERNREYGKIAIIPRSKGLLYQLTPQEAEEYGAESIQLVEGYSYEYTLVQVNPGHHLRENEVIQPSRIHSTSGRIEPGLETGLLPLVLQDEQHHDVAYAAVEVRSSKIEYFKEYRLMLDYIASKSIGLLTEIRAPAQVRLAPDTKLAQRTTSQRFAFLRSLLTAREFRDAVQRVIAMPQRQPRAETYERDISRGFKPNAKSLVQIARRTPRVELQSDHPLHRVMKSQGIGQPSVPTRILSTRSKEIVDTPENRFVKYAISSFEEFLLSIEDHIKNSNQAGDVRLLREVVQLRQELTRILAKAFFKEIAEPQTLPLGSPVLQRRSGYREILQAWLSFNLAARLVWQGGERDVYGAGKRDIARLYEYWLYFQLLELMASVFSLDQPISKQLIEWTADRFDLRLKSGRHLALRGQYVCGPRKLSVQFSYNRTFSRKDIGLAAGYNYPAAGSWTRPMRPDYTLSLWPAELTIGEAERQELIVHVHFDAKYKVDQIVELFGPDNSEHDGDDGEEAYDSVTQSVQEGTLREEMTSASREDLLRMHAYRDAIRRTEGSYILYPGAPTVGDQCWFEFHEILPGIGAFAVRPGSEKYGLTTMANFLRDVADHVCDLTTRRQNLRDQLFRIEEPNGSSP